MVSHNQTGLSIPIESGDMSRFPYKPYRSRMAKDYWRDWGTRFRRACRDKQSPLTTKEVAERLDMAESSVRSWLNGTREINLSDFFLLCSAAGIEPASILFAVDSDHGLSLLHRAWGRSNQQGRELLSVAAEAALRLSGGANQEDRNGVVQTKRRRS